MKTTLSKHLVVAVATLVCVLSAGCTRQLTEEQKQEIASLKQALSVIQTDIADAEEKRRRFSGGLVGSLVETRLEILRVNKALFEQRIVAIESGAEVRQVVQASRPDPERAAKLGGEIADLEKSIAAEKQGSERYGGLLGAMKEVTIATKESTLAQLTHSYLAAKYGLAVPNIRGQEATGKQTTPSAITSSKATPNANAMVAGDGPFGLVMGMKAELFGDRLNQIAAGVYTLSDVPRPNEMFSDYAARIGEQAGLCWIKALGPEIQVNSFGSELKARVDKVAEMLTDLYGQGKKQDFLYAGSIWRDSNDWMMGLLKKERVYAKVWEAKGNASLGRDLKSIYVAASANSSSSGRVIVEYAFVNEDQCEKEIKKAGAKGL